MARTLVRDGLATWQPLAPVGVGGLRRFTGPASFDVLTSLLAITGGEPEWTGALWREWQHRGVVLDTDAGWVFAAGGRDAVLDEVDELIGDRLRRSIGPDLNRLARAGRILASGALEGPRFTAPAVADALGLDPDELMDFVDETLTIEDDRPDGLLAWDGWVKVDDETGTRTLAIYRFARKLD